MALSGQTCVRPTCAIQRPQPHHTQAVLRVALVPLSGGGDGCRLGRASGSTALLPDACRPMPVSLLGSLVALSDRQTCTRPTCAIQRSQPHRAQAVLRVALVALSGGGDGWRRRASGSTALLPDACRPMPVSLLGRALACQDNQTCTRPTCAIQQSQLHRTQAVLRVAVITGRRRRRLAVGGWGEWQHSPCSQTPAALCLCPFWGASSLATTPKLASGPPVPFSSSSRTVLRPCCAWH